MIKNPDVDTKVQPNNDDEVRGRIKTPPPPPGDYLAIKIPAGGAFICRSSRVGGRQKWSRADTPTNTR